MSASGRRGAPRIAKRLPLRLTHERGELTTKTENLSASGAYCTVTEFIPLMTRLRIRLELIDRAAPTPVTCEGVVVRVEPATQTPARSTYKIAVFFSDLSKPKRSVLAQYVQRHGRDAIPQ